MVKIFSKAQLKISHKLAFDYYDIQIFKIITT